MTKAVYLNAEMLNEPSVQLLRPREFRKKLLAAIEGERNEFEGFVRVKVSARWHGCWNWRELRERIFRRDDYTCQWCGQRGGHLECDHVVPFSKGGSHSEDNLVTACKPCNRAKRDKTPEEWARCHA